MLLIVIKTISSFKQQQSKQVKIIKYKAIDHIFSKQMCNAPCSHRLLDDGRLGVTLYLLCLTF